MSQKDFDLVVIGGGPAGSTLAAFVAMQGHRVLLLERETFPRYQIGESLLPATIHGVCVMLGVSEELKQANFTRKLGGTFRWGKSATPWTFAFSSLSTFAGPTSYAYQVERSKFDNILLRNAQKKGVDVRERHAVLDLLQEGGRVSGVRFTDESGAEHAVTARFVADAGGNTSRLHRHAGERVYSQFFRNVALFCYFEGGKRLPPPNEGNILSAAFRDGWFWYIPLSPTLTSVGAVISRERAESLKGGHEAAMQEFIASCPIIQEYLAGATRVTEGPYGQFRVRKDYSYCNTRFFAPGFFLVGDAACFIDPVFSSGVHLATYSALLAARSVNSCLKDGLDEARSMTEFEMRYRREYGNFYQFLTAFYDMHRDEESYFWEARKVIHSEERANEAFIRLVSGVSSSGESVYASPDDFFRATSEVAGSIESVVQRAEKPQRDVTAAPGDDFMRGLTREIVQVQLQAYLGPRGAKDTPLFEGGLVPSRDGLHWREPAAAAARTA